MMPNHGPIRLICFWILVLSARAAYSSTPSEISSNVGALITQIIKRYFDSCHLMFVISEEDDTALSGALKLLAGWYWAGMVISPQHIYSSEAYDERHTLLTNHLKNLNAKFACHVILLDVTREDVNQFQFRFLDDIDLHLKPETYVLMIGNQSPRELSDRMLHNALRNTAQVVYLSFPNDAANESMRTEGIETLSNCSIKTDLTQENGHSCDDVTIIWRCLYCTSGDVGVIETDTWSLADGFQEETDLFPDQFTNFHRHQFKIVSMDWYPMLDFQRNTNESATTVTPKDSLDYRMLSAISSILNFTYEMRTPWDNQWGVSQNNGNWTVSLWVAILLLSMLAGLVLWLLQKLWARMEEGRKDLEISTSLLYSWGILLEDPPVNLPTNITAQMVVGWWWVFCMLLMTAYRSSLIAHLSVPSKSPTIDKFEQLLEQDGWTWGMEGTYGIGWEWFKKSTVPTVQKINERIEAMEPEQHLARVLEGRHAFLTWKYYIQTIIASNYTDTRGFTPLHTGRQEYISFGGYGWGFRQGAPFRRSIDDLKLRLMECGLINYWMNDLIVTPAREARRKNRQEGTLPKGEETAGRVVLSLQQLQGIFYLLGLGSATSLIIFTIEHFGMRFMNH